MDTALLAVPVTVFAAVATGVFAAAGAAGAPNRLSRRLGGVIRRETTVAPAQQIEQEAVQLLRERKYSNWALLDQMISRRSWAEREADELDRADVPLRVGEYMLMRGVAAGALALAAYVVTGMLLVAMAAAPVGYFVPILWVKRLQRQRKRKFDDQLVEALMLLASTLKSGYSFLQGMEAVAREMPSPISDEFDRLIKEISVGARVDDALLALVARARSDDLELAVTAILIQRTVGGELAGILETIVKTIRERQKIKRDVASLTAQQRWSGYIIGALPIVLMVLIGMGNSDYIGELLFTFHGQLMLAAAAVMEVIGFFMILRIIAIEV
jgi:tight adherence protein B